jgi:hypothetical protein
MKSLFIALTFACTLFVTSAYANDGIITGVVKQSFKTTFQDAQDVKWSEENGYCIATFTRADEQLSAYYTQDGTLVVVAKCITSSDLPKPLKRALTEQYEGANIAGVYQMESEHDIAYFATIEKDGKRMIVKAGGKKWQVLKVDKK